MYSLLGSVELIVIGLALVSSLLNLRCPICENIIAKKLIPTIALIAEGSYNGNRLYTPILNNPTNIFAKCHFFILGIATYFQFINPCFFPAFYPSKSPHQYDRFQTYRTYSQ